MSYQVNISIDDVSPHPMSSVKVLDRCFETIEIFPDIKFTLFVPMAYWRQRPPTRTEIPLELQVFPDFCDIIRDLPKKNFEIGYHGLWHGVPPHNNNDEFKEVDYETADKKLKNMFHIEHVAKLKGIFKPIFRPPAWKLSPDGFKACSDNGIDIFAISPKEGPKSVYSGADEAYKCVYYNCNPPFDPLVMHPKTEIVYHACEWDRNYLSVEKTKELIDFLKKYDNEPLEFCFMDGLL